MQKLYVLFDSKSETYTAPTLNPARGQALRSFSDGVNANDGNMLSKHPEDFTLFEIGEYDIHSGEIILHPSKIAIANGVDVKIAA